MLFLVSLDVSNDAAGHVHVVALLDVEGSQALVQRLNSNVHECDVCPIKDLARISVEKVLKLEYRSISHWVACQRLDKL